MARFGRQTLPEGTSVALPAHTSLLMSGSALIAQAQLIVGLSLQVVNLIHQVRIVHFVPFVAKLGLVKVDPFVQEVLEVKAEVHSVFECLRPLQTDLVDLRVQLAEA